MSSWDRPACRPATRLRRAGQRGKAKRRAPARWAPTGHCAEWTARTGRTPRELSLIHISANAHDLRFVSLRYFNACGAHPNGKIGEAHNPETHLIPLILQVPNGKREYISIFGNDYETKDGTCVRDYIHVNDLAQAHILAMEYLRKGNDSNIFNLGNGVGFTVKEVRCV